MAKPDDTQSERLRTFLNGGAVLLGENGKSTLASQSTKGLALEDVLRDRLHSFYETTGEEVEGYRTDPKLQTAFCCLRVLFCVHSVLTQYPDLSLGTRDTAQLRTMLSILFKWGTEPLLTSVLAAIPEGIMRSTVPSGAQVIDLTSSADDFVHLSKVISRLLAISLDVPKDDSALSASTFVVSIIRNRYITDVLRPAICLAWMPDKVKSKFPQTGFEFRQQVLQLLSGLPPSQTIATLGSILSASSEHPAYIRRTCSALLSQQLLRPRGIAGLLSAVFGEDDASNTDADAPLEKLEHVAKVITSVPSGKNKDEYFNLIVPRTLVLLTPDLTEHVPLSHKRAIAFTLSRMLNDVIASKLLLRTLHESFLEVHKPSPITTGDDSNALPTLISDRPTDVLRLTPTKSLRTISTILTNVDPSPFTIASILTPIFQPIYSLHEHFHLSRGLAKLGDPVVREIIVGLMATWAKVVQKDEVVNVLWGIVESQMSWAKKYTWEADITGEICLIQAQSSYAPAIGDIARMLHAFEFGPSKIPKDENINSNPLDLRPDPLVFVSFIQSIGNEDISSEIFVKLLEGYRKDKNHNNDEEDPRSTLLRLHLILKMQERLGDSASPANILKRPQHILSFIKHALEDSIPTKPGSPDQHLPRSRLDTNVGISTANLRIVKQEEEAMDVAYSHEEDSDDEDAPGLEDVRKGEEMPVTAINLLLSLLEANPSLSARSTPILNEIYLLLEPLSHTDSESMRPLAREARLVMTARLASDYNSEATNAKRKDTLSDEESPEEIYQRALKLLQDPVLPVRAHGLLLLRELVSPYHGPKQSATPDIAKGKTSSQKPSGFPSVPQLSPVPPSRAPAALIPAILSIFLEAIQDDDSYIFLNAVQGLAAMVDGWGADVLKGVVEVYIKGLDDITSGDIGGGLRKGKNRSGVGRVGKEVVEMEQRDLDVRLRVGEALGQVIRRCGDALGKYVDIIVPPLLYTLSATHLPTTLRTSSVSLLAQAVGTNSLALARYSQDLCETMVDLVQTETVQAKSADNAKQHQRRVPGISVKGAPQDEDGRAVAGNSGKMDPLSSSDEPSQLPSHTIDSQPTSTNSKFPPLRRAALHFIAVLLRTFTDRLYDSPGSRLDELSILLQGKTLHRAITVLEYVAQTDQDEVVRAMAKENLSLVGSMKKAMIGI